MRIFVARHGQTSWNAQKILQGQKDIGLNEEGRLQAREIGELLKDKSIDVIVSSTLKRAKETADIIGEIIRVPVFGDSRLMERCFGKSEGLNKQEIKELNSHYPQTHYLWHYLMNVDFNGIEKMQDFCARVYACLDEIISMYHDKTLLIVAHGGVLIPMHCYFTKYPLENIEFRENVKLLKNGGLAEYIL